MVGHRTGASIYRRLVAVLMVGAVVSTTGAVAQAQEDEQQVGDPRAEAVSVLDGEYQIRRPNGWNILATDPETADAAFESATDDTARIEVRISDGISARRWERFRRTFDTELQEAGFSADEPEERVIYGGRPGLRRQYRLERGGEVFQLVVWHTHGENRAWVFSAFFTESRREAHLRTFEILLEQIAW